MRNLALPSPITLTAAGLGALAVLVVGVDDSWRTALLTLIAVVVIAATRLRFAPVAAAILATIVAALALGGHAPTLDSRPAQAAVVHVVHHHSPRVAAHHARR